MIHFLDILQVPRERFERAVKDKDGQVKKYYVDEFGNVLNPVGENDNLIVEEPPQPTEEDETSPVSVAAASLAVVLLLGTCFVALRYLMPDTAK